MKASFYNIYLLDKKEKNCLVFNTLYRSILRIDDDVYSSIKNNKLDEIDDTVLEVLKNGKIIFDDNVNELDMLRIVLNRNKYNANSDNDFFCHLRTFLFSF